MLIFKKMIKIIAFITIIFSLNKILLFMLDPKSSDSKTMWKSFYQEQNLDTLFIGSSVCQRTFNPYIIDDILKINSFNMGTPAQILSQTYEGINETIKKHKIKTVILGIGHFTFTQKENLNAEITFINAKIEKKDIKEKIKEGINFIFSKEHIKKTESINYFFPWVYNNVGFNPKNILENIEAKIKNKNLKNGKENIIYNIGKGFGIAKTSHDYNNVGDKISGLIYSSEIYYENFKVLKKISELCKKNNIDLIVINSPHTIYDILSYGDEYFFTMYKLKEFFKDLEVPYYDFNLIKPNIFQSEEDYFYDHEHLNQKGSTEFSKSFANFMKLREKNKNMDEYFYTPEEYLASIKHISIVNFDIEKEKEGINIVAKAYTGSKVKVEYEFLIYDDTNNEYKIIREYNENPKYFYSIIKNKKYKIRVNTRQVGTNIPYERYYEKEVEIKDY